MICGNFEMVRYGMSVTLNHQRKNLSWFSFQYDWQKSTFRASARKWI